MVLIFHRLTHQFTSFSEFPPSLKMPYKCCVPGCKSNYNSAKNENHISVFRFPQDEELRASWLNHIPRKLWSPNRSSRICILHFDSKFISKIENFIDKDGNHRTFPRSRPVLLPNAVPTIFMGFPSYVPSTVEPKRTASPAKRQKSMIDLDEPVVSEDIVSNFDDFVKEYKTYVDNLRWKSEVSDREVIIYMIDFSEIPKVTVSVNVDHDMDVTVCENGSYVSVTDLKGFSARKDKVKLQRWSQFENLLNRYAADLNSSTKSQHPIRENIGSHVDKIIK